MGFFGSKGITADTTEAIAVSANECWTAQRTKVWKGNVLESTRQGDAYATNQTLHVHYKYCCYDTCFLAINFVLQHGQVATLDGAMLISDLGDIGSCLAFSGACDLHKGIAVWDARQVRKPCAFVEHSPSPEVYAVEISHPYYTVVKIQEAFTHLQNRSQPSAGLCLPRYSIMMDQGVVLATWDKEEFRKAAPDLAPNISHPHEEEHLRKRRQTPSAKPVTTPPDSEERDPVNAKLQYLEYKLAIIELAEFREVWMHLCEIFANQLQLIWNFVRMDATTGARVLFHRKDVYAKFAGQVLMV